jgi:hypothetical protein
MKAKQVLFLLLVFCAAQLAAQTKWPYRALADSCAKAGNFRAADSLYTLLIYVQPDAENYKARAGLRLKTEPCRACGDLFAASVLGDKNAVNQFRRNCYRANTTLLCERDSSSLFCSRGKVTMKQKIDTNYFRIRQTDTAFQAIKTYYVSGKDTLRLSADTCVMAEPLRFKIYQYIGNNNYYKSGTILPFVIGLYSKPSENRLSVRYLVTFSHDGVVLDAQPESGIRENVLDDAMILRLLNEMPPIGNLGCKPGAYRYSFVIYFSHQW